MKEGWGFPYNARKAHYFLKGEGHQFGNSLCGAWMYGGLLEEGDDDSPDNCVSCKRKLKKRKEKANQPS